ncbi:MAG: ABC transporter permease [Chloroflexi bacterium]|nr:ABC transporter permease [Chloroflexota bacterium]
MQHVLQRESRWQTPALLVLVRRCYYALGGEGVLGVVMLLVLVGVAVLAPHLAPYDPEAFTGSPLEHPSREHRLGTNDVGQDILSELIYGARISLQVAAGAAAGTVLLAVIIGGTAGYAGGWIDLLLMRLVDVLLALPRLPLLILVTALLGAGLQQMILTIALLFWPTTARIIRARVQSLRQREYITLARGFGGGPLYLFVRHILPPITPLVVFGLVTAAGRAVALEAGLAFLGLGDPTAKSWGLMMRYALNFPGLFLTNRWQWWMLPPGICITLLILALTFVGIGLESRLDARLDER